MIVLFGVAVVVLVAVEVVAHAAWRLTGGIISPNWNLLGSVIDSRGRVRWPGRSGADRHSRGTGARRRRDRSSTLAPA